MIEALKKPIRSLYVRLAKWKFEFTYRRECFEENSKKALALIKSHNIENPQQLYKEYLRDFKKYQFTFIEWYYQFKLNGKADSEKNSFISALEEHRYYRKNIDDYHRALFRNKATFLTKFNVFIKRQYLCCNADTTIEDFRNRFQGKDLIVKPATGDSGQGIFKISFCEVETGGGIKKFLDKAIELHYVIEECIVADDDLKSFHAQSLNTIRVVTYRDNSGIRIFRAVARFGVGDSVVDNADAGGVFCSIDIDYGKFSSNAFDVMGNEYLSHPDTGMKFLNHEIYKWDEIKSTCIKAHELVTTPIVGWDVCINQNGEVEFIEGNHAPGMGMIQTPNHRGVAKEFIRIVTRKNI